ncbi:MAG TPA: methylated-DNA--[protein]-cysteine S-methyltransferase [Gammaproteobacteria bacterium]|nr:methylated-DNA--[protein]-cysteine S-methyltransferase [Gammaproteobacteria bacterium]
MKKVSVIKFLPSNATFDEINSPVGKLTMISSTKGLHAILWDNDRDNPQVEKVIHQFRQSKDDPILRQTKIQLSEYFQNKRTTFDLPLVMDGTDFQIKVWKELLKIPYANTISYSEQAYKIGDKNKARAVGTANGRNPIPIVIPCHRVIGQNGHLTGFAGGVEKKALLLQLEKNHQAVSETL